jgi:hypothetical protein
MEPKKDDKKIDIKVKHPEFGYVEFHGMSIRQKEILDEYVKLCKINKKLERNTKKNKTINDAEIRITSFGRRY